MWMGADTGVPSDNTVALDAMQDRPKDRGNLLAIKASWSARLLLPLTGHILYERLEPGGYYDPGAETAHFLRFELSSSL